MYDEDLVGGLVSPPPGPEPGGWGGVRSRQFGVAPEEEGPADVAHAAPSPARPEGLDHSVVVYGFARHQVGDTLRRLRELGTVVHSAVPAHGNYMLVQFETGVATANAVALSGRRVTLGGEPTMLGVRRFCLEVRARASPGVRGRGAAKEGESPDSPAVPCVPDGRGRISAGCALRAWGPYATVPEAGPAPEVRLRPAASRPVAPGITPR